MLDEYEVEGTHDVLDHHGYEPYSTPVDRMMSNDAMGFAYANAMADYNAE